MTEVPDNMSEADGMTESARGLIEGRYYPVISGPRPGMSAVLALAFANLTFLLLPTAETFLAVTTLLFFASAGTALRMRPNARRSDLVSIGLLAAVAFLWGYAAYFSFAAYTAVHYHMVLSIGALVFSFARYVRSFRYAWATAVSTAASCDADLLANYAEHLLDNRPGTAASHVAREFYRIASEEVLQFVEPAPRHIGLLKRYIDLLQSGIGGYVDIQEAIWWTERIRELENGVRVPVSCGIEDQKGRFSAREISTGAGDGSLGYAGGRPAWRVRVANPAKCETSDLSVKFHGFLLPSAGLIACLARLDQGPKPPLLLHRVYDVSDPDSEAFLMALEHNLTWRLELRRIRDAGAEARRDAYEPDRPARVRTLDLRASGLMECLDAVIQHNSALGVELDGSAALNFFMTTLATHGGAEGLDAAWAAVDAACLRYEE